MGMNYFTPGEVTCDGCSTSHHCKMAIHLGKSSFGWKFTFAWNDGEYYKNLDEMKSWLKGKQIVNEEGETITYDEFWDMVKRKENEKNDHTTYEHTMGSHLDFGVVVDGIYFMRGYFS